MRIRRGRVRRRLARYNLLVFVSFKPLPEGPPVSVLVEFSMSPMDKGPSLSKYVARSIEIVADSGLPYRLGPMGTCLEGEWEEVMGVIEKCYRRMSEDCGRITCSIKVDARAGSDHRLNTKTKTIENILGRPIDQ